jgi:hypothetical protein
MKEQTPRFCPACGDLLSYDDKDDLPRYSDQHKEMVCAFCAANVFNPNNY